MKTLAEIYEGLNSRDPIKREIAQAYMSMLPKCDWAKWTEYKNYRRDLETRREAALLAIKD